MQCPISPWRPCSSAQVPNDRHNVWTCSKTIATITPDQKWPARHQRSPRFFQPIEQQYHNRTEPQYHNRTKLNVITVSTILQSHNSSNHNHNILIAFSDVVQQVQSNHHNDSKRSKTEATIDQTERDPHSKHQRIPYNEFCLKTPALYTFRP